MRKDGAGMLCQSLAGTGFNNATAWMRLAPIDYDSWTPVYDGWLGVN